ncbi:mucin-2-like [Bacillus rossius redtenbacheri]|uniref:mucin-2-like n=1 Tax=Bacillus rossius redtenbacheri TaxID=93214 RepID=UPI002FDCA4F7
MESHDGRTLLRTMSFISSRAKALKQRFVPSQRSLSVTWPDHATRAFIDEDHPPSPDLGGSLLSLLDESENSVVWDSKDTKTCFQTQRSRSLDSLNSAPFNIHSSSTMKDLQISTVKTQRKVSLSVKIPRPMVSKLRQENTQLISSALVSEQRYCSENTLQTNDIIPKIPGPQTFRVSAPSTPETSTTYSLYSPVFVTNVTPNTTCVTGSHVQDASPMKSIQISMTPSVSQISIIPKIPGPPPSPKTSRPTTPRTLEPMFCNNSSLFVLPVSPGFSNPSSPKEFENAFLENSVIPKIPGPPLSPKLSCPTKNKQPSNLFLDTYPYSSAINFPILSPKSLENQCPRRWARPGAAVPPCFHPQHFKTNSPAFSSPPCIHTSRGAAIA